MRCTEYKYNRVVVVNSAPGIVYICMSYQNRIRRLVTDLSKLKKGWYSPSFPTRPPPPPRAAAGESAEKSRDPLTNEPVFSPPSFLPSVLLSFLNLLSPYFLSIFFILILHSVCSVCECVYRIRTLASHFYFLLLSFLCGPNFHSSFLLHLLTET